MRRRTPPDQLVAAIVREVGRVNGDRLFQALRGRHGLSDAESAAAISTAKEQGLIHDMDGWYTPAERGA